MEEAPPRIADQDRSRRMLTIPADPAPDIMRKVMRELASEGDLAAQQNEPKGELNDVRA